MTRRFRDEKGGTLLLGFGWLMACLMFMTLAISLTGLALQKRQLVDYAGGAAIHAAGQQANFANAINCGLDPSVNCVLRTAGDPGGSRNGEIQASAKIYINAVANAASGRGQSGLNGISVSTATGFQPTATSLSRVRVVLDAKLNPPMIGWLTKMFNGGIPITVSAYSASFEQR